MRNTLWVLFLLGCSGITALAQQAKGGQALIQAKPVPKLEPQTAIQPAKPEMEILGQPAVFGGYLMDFFKAERKRAMFDLAAPLNAGLDLENVSFYPQSEAVRGIILFSIKF